MKYMARKLHQEPTPAAVLGQIGDVVGLMNQRYIVRCATSDVIADRALSCLITPVVGDRVLVAHAPDGDGEDGAAYVLAVLERTGAEPVCVETRGDTQWAVRDGGFAIAAEGPIDLVTKSALSLVAGKAKLLAGEGLATFGTLAVAARSVLAEADTVKVAAGWIDSVVTRMSERIRRSYRVVEETEQVRAGQVDMVAEKNLTMRATNAVITAKTLAKVNAGQVHIG